MTKSILDKGTMAIAIVLQQHLSRDSAEERARNIAQMLLLGEGQESIYQALTPNGAHPGVLRCDRGDAVLDVYRAWIAATASSYFDAWRRIITLCEDKPFDAAAWLKRNGYVPESQVN